MYDTALTRLIEHNEWAEIPQKLQPEKAVLLIPLTIHGTYPIQ